MMILILCVFGHALLAGSTITSDIFWENTSLGAYVVDNFFPQGVNRLRKILTEGPMMFNGDDRNYAANFSILAGFKTKWIAPGLYSSSFIKRLSNAIQELYPNVGEVYADNIEGRIIERGDFNPVSTACSQNTSEMLAVIMLNKKWNKNDYGDFGLYNNNDEIATSIHPKHGRIIFMKCDTKYKVTPPSLGKEKRLYLAFFELGLQKRKSFPNFEEPELTSTQFLKSSVNQDLITKYLNEKIDMSKYVTKTYTTLSQKKIFVFDGLLPEEFVNSLFKYVSEKLPYYEQEIDTSSEDNVRWVLGLDDTDFTTDGPIWPIVSQAITYVSQIETFTPYDLSCNHIRRSDVTTIHTDCRQWEKEYTNLIYLNPNWQPNMHGETVFLEGDEFVAAVLPKFGRLVVFDGAIDHSARPPSPNINGARYSFAIKTAVNAEEAKRRFKESSEA